MPDIWDAQKVQAWSQYLLSVTIRYVAACDCSSCRAIRATFEYRYGAEPHRRRDVHPTHPRR
jgi:hypothetical protein